MLFNNENCCPPAAFPPKVTAAPDPCVDFVYAPELSVWNVSEDIPFEPVTLNINKSLDLEIRDAAFPGGACCADSAPVLTYLINPAGLTLSADNPFGSYLGVTFDYIDGLLHVENFATNSAVFFITATYQYCKTEAQISFSFDVLTI